MVVANRNGSRGVGVYQGGDPSSDINEVKESARQNDVHAKMTGEESALREVRRWEMQQSKLKKTTLLVPVKLRTRLRYSKLSPSRFHLYAQLTQTTNHSIWTQRFILSLRASQHLVYPLNWADIWSGKFPPIEMLFGRFSVAGQGNETSAWAVVSWLENIARQVRADTRESHRPASQFQLGNDDYLPLGPPIPRRAES